MPNQAETKPHVLTITADERCDGCKGDDPAQWCDPRCLRYEVDCPYDEAGRLHVCMAYVECGCRLPEEPDPAILPEPQHAPWNPAISRLDGMGSTGYAYGSDIIAVAAWTAFDQMREEHDEIHPHGWEPTGACWVQTGDHCWPEPLDGIPNAPGTYRVSVDNEGHFEDSVLVVYPWREEAGDGEVASNSTQERLVTA